MARVTVIARPGKITTDNVQIVMHAVVAETHTLANTITDHPVEEGFNPSDHCRPEPEIVQMDCRISNTSLSSTSATEAVKAGEFTIQTTTAAAAAAGAIGDTDGYAYQQWLKLKDLRNKGTLVRVATTLGDYDSMAIQSITAPRNAKNYDAVAFSITFKKVRVVQNKLTRTVVAAPQVQKKKSAGTKTPKAVDDTDPLRTEVNFVKDTLKNFHGGH